MKKPPAFQLYAADFYMDTLGWEVDTVGLYIRLLLHQWVNGSVPNDLDQIARIGQCVGQRKWRANVARMWREQCHKFVPVPGTNNLINLRLEDTRNAQMNYKKNQSESGRRGVEAKKLKGVYPFNKSSDPSSDPSTDPSSEDQALHSSSSLKALLGSSSSTGSATDPSKKSQLPVPKEGFSDEEIAESSRTLTEEQILALANELVKTEKFPKAHEFIQVQRNMHRNVKAVLHALNRCLLARPGRGGWNPWAYCETILSKENGNFNEREAISGRR